MSAAREARGTGGNLAARVALAAGRDTSPELLVWLAGDPAPEVRAAVAANRATPPQAGLVLAADADAGVRTALARRLGALSPGLGPRARNSLARFTAAALARLVEDAATDVRAAIADAVAGLPDAPRELVLRLARDTELPVAGPVLLLSPLLTEADLLALVAAPPAEFTRRTVAARPRITEAVTEAVAASADSPAIAALLGNPSAAIREATLDRLVDAAAEEPCWQAALVRRPTLPPRAARALGAIVAGQLLEVLSARPDLPPGLAETLRERLGLRLAMAPEHAAVREAARSGDRARLASLIAGGTGMPETRIEAALALRSPRVIAALCWRADWPAMLAEEVQAALGIPPARILRANAEGGWTVPLSELDWQIELLNELPA